LSSEPSTKIIKNETNISNSSSNNPFGRRKYRFLILGSVLTFLGFISIYYFVQPQFIAEKAIVVLPKAPIEKEIPPLTAENVYIELVKHNVKEPEIVVKQSILETGWYKCNNCSLAKNNIFGFRKNKKYVEFDNWVEGIAYYKKWQDKNYTKEGNYYKFLTNVGYATSTEYISKLKSVKLDFDTEKAHNSQMKNALLALVSMMTEKNVD
jgi:hypothetical protein